MSKVKDYKVALEEIKVATSLEQAKEIAAKATFEVDGDAERRKMIAGIGQFLIENGLIFETAESIAAAAANAGFKTPRGKVWSKASIARYMSDIRQYVQNVLISRTATAAARDEFGDENSPERPQVDADGIRIAGTGRVRVPVTEPVVDEVGFDDFDEDDLSDLVA